MVQETRHVIVYGRMDMQSGLPLVFLSSNLKDDFWTCFPCSKKGLPIECHHTT
jgi:hypothetical protein